MNLNKMLLLLFVLALVGGTTTRVAAQNDVSVSWIRISDDFSTADTTITWFANTAAGTYNVDSINAIYNEYEAPPPPPDGLVAVFTGFRPPAAGTYGGFPVDIHGIPANATVKDTFQLSITYNGPNADFSDFHLRWPGASFLGARCDSIFLIPRTLGLVDGAGNPLPARIDMLGQNSLDLQQPIQAIGGSRSFVFRIFRYGVHLIDNLTDPLPTIVREISNRVPASFKLGQNYPNPFNPSTTLRFDIQKRATADISVYNILGEKVATLVAGNLSAGTYSTTWNGVTAQGIPASSGVYFVRMTALSLDGKAEAFSSLRKIVLMK